MAGLAATAVLPRLCGELRNTSPRSPELGPPGRLAVTAVPLPLATPSLVVTTGAVVLTPPSCTRSRIVPCPDPSASVKLTVIVPVPLALLAVVIQYAHW